VPPCPSSVACSLVLLCRVSEKDSKARKTASTKAPDHLWIASTSVLPRFIAFGDSRNPRAVTAGSMESFSSSHGVGGRIEGLGFGGDDGRHCDSRASTRVTCWKKNIVEASGSCVVLVEGLV
jgi:hypothetical protein